MLWGVIRALQGDAPADIPFEGVLRLLEPHGTSDGPPAVPPEMRGDDRHRHRHGDRAGAGASARRRPGRHPGRRRHRAAAATTAIPTRRDDRPPRRRPAPRPPDTEASILAELDALVGLDGVKAAIRRLLALQHLNEQRAAAGLPDGRREQAPRVHRRPGHGQDDRRAARRPAVQGRRAGQRGPARRGRPRRPGRGLRRPDRAQGAGRGPARRSAACCSSTRPTPSRRAATRTSAARPSRRSSR